MFSPSKYQDGLLKGRENIFYIIPSKRSIQLISLAALEKQ